MDDKMMQQLLATYSKGGMTPAMSAENANRIRQFGAANPEVLEHRAMGMRGSALDDNSDLLDLEMDKHLQDTAPPGRVEVGQPVLDKQPAIPAAAAVPQRAPSKLQTGETGGEPMQAGTTINGGQPLVPQSKQQDGSGFDLGKWLTALLGVTSGGALAGARGVDPAMLQLPGRGDQLALPAPAQKLLPAPRPALPPANVNTLESGAPEIPKSGIYDATKGPVAADVADENDAMARKLMDDIRKRNSQAGADATVNAAKRLLRR